MVKPNTFCVVRVLSVSNVVALWIWWPEEGSGESFHHLFVQKGVDGHWNQRLFWRASTWNWSLLFLVENIVLCNLSESIVWVLVSCCCCFERYESELLEAVLSSISDCFISMPGGLSCKLTVYFFAPTESAYLIETNLYRFFDWNISQKRLNIQRTH